MRVFGHPLHPLFVHFPSALLPMDLVLSFLSWYRNDAGFSAAAFYCLAGGTIMGLLTLLTGIMDLLWIPKKEKAAWAAGMIHGFVNGTLLLIYALFAWRAWQQYPDLNRVTIPVLAVKSVLMLALFFGNYLGGQLLYKYRVGIKSGDVV